MPSTATDARRHRARAIVDAPVTAQLADALGAPPTRADAGTSEKNAAPTTDPLASWPSVRTRRERLAASAKRFAEDTTEHVMVVLRDRDETNPVSGEQTPYRHLSFHQPGTGMYWFDLITTPGYLYINGDMGSYVFARVPDMFEFFRGRPGGPGDRIDAAYWAEKLQADSGIRDFSRDRLLVEIRDALEHARPNLTEETFARVCADALSEVVDGTNSAEEAHEALGAFTSNGIDFYDTWEWDLTDFTTQFLWCCFAIRWGIARYDEAHQAASTSGTPALV